MGDDAIDEEKLVLCCALCCANMSTYPSADCLGCSGKVGMCCLNAEFCCKVRLRFPFPHQLSHMHCFWPKYSLSFAFPYHDTDWRQPGAPCLPCVCCGPQCEFDGCSCFNLQAHCCCCVASAALPCNDEVPIAVSFMGLTLYPKCGCMVPMKEIMDR